MEHEGIIDPNKKPPTPNPVIGSQMPYKAPDAQPVTTEVQDLDTVQGQMNKLSESGSKYTSLHGREAARQANTRGLINSNMAYTAGVEASIKAGLPIAQQDAGTYRDTRFRNQDVQNKFLENRQNTNLNMESAAHGSGLKKDEMTLGSGLKKDEMTLGSGLKQGEMTLGSGLKQGEMTLGSGLKQGEMTLGSSLKQGEMTLGSELTNEENTLLADLERKRDEGLAELTAEENQQLADLQAKRDAALSELAKGEAEFGNQLAIKRDINSAQLNSDLATLESTLRESELELSADLKTTLELLMNDEKFSDEMKLQIVGTMNNIIRDTQQQITDIGLSDRTASQQAAAIQLLEDNRDASLAVYENLLSSFDDWNWETDFTPERVMTPETPGTTETTETSGGGGGGGGATQSPDGGGLGNADSGGYGGGIGTGGGPGESFGPNGGF